LVVGRCVCCKYSVAKAVTGVDSGAIGIRNTGLSEDRNVDMVGFQCPAYWDQAAVAAVEDVVGGDGEGRWALFSWRGGDER
jgi:hypothetical protein